MKNNITTTNIKDETEFTIIDDLIKLETKRRVYLVPEAKDLGIMAACNINGKFVLVSDYEVPSEIAIKLEEA